MHTEVVSGNRSDIVGLRRVSHPKVVGQGDTLLREPGKVGVTSGLVVVSVLQPDDDESVKDSARNLAGWA